MIRQCRFPSPVPQPPAHSDACFLDAVSRHCTQPNMTSIPPRVAFLLSLSHLSRGMKPLLVRANNAILTRQSSGTRRQAAHTPDRLIAPAVLSALNSLFRVPEALVCLACTDCPLTPLPTESFVRSRTCPGKRREEKTWRVGLTYTFSIDKAIPLAPDRFVTYRTITWRGKTTPTNK